MYDIRKFDIATSVTDALLEVFDMMLSMQLELTDETGSQLLVDEERIVGSVSLAGRVMGTINIHIGRDFARQMTAAMLGVEMDEIEDADDVKDVISEVCNIVGGGLKSNFCDAGLTCRLSTPSFTTGSDFTIESLNTSRRERYVFSQDKQQVVVEVGVRANDTGDDDEEALRQRAEAPPPDPEALDEFQIGEVLAEGVGEVFETMLSMALVPDPEANASRLQGERIVGTVNFIGLLMGSMNIFVGKSFSREMTAAMLGIETEEVSGEDDVKDVVSELCNMVGGNLKSKFNDAGLSCQLSTPSFTSGSDFRIESQSMDRYERLAFRSGEETLFVEVGFKLLASSEMAGTGKGASAQLDLSEALEEIREPETAGPGPEPMVEPPVQTTKKTAEDAGAEAGNESLEAAKASSDDPQRAIDALIRAEKKSAQERPPRPAEPEHTGPSPEDLARIAEQRHRNLNIVMEIPVELTIELGRARKPLAEVLGVDDGSVIEFTSLAGEPVDVLVNDTLIAKGEIVVEREKYGVQITETIGRMERIKSLGF